MNMEMSLNLWRTREYIVIRTYHIGIESRLCSSCMACVVGEETCKLELFSQKELVCVSHCSHGRVGVGVKTGKDVWIQPAHSPLICQGK